MTLPNAAHVPLQQPIAPPSPSFAPWPVFGEREISAAIRVLQSGRVNYWTGEEGRQFETEFASFVGTTHAMAVANGTVALELALQALGIGPGDEVITTSRTFIASASCVVMRGAVPVIADVDPDSQNLTADTIRRRLSPRTRAIIAVHLAGWPCDMDPIMALAREHGLKVIEDCAQAHGASYKGRPVGSLGRCGRLFLLPGQDHDHRRRGRDADDQRPRALGEGLGLQGSRQELRGLFTASRILPVSAGCMKSFGTNWRMTEMQAAIGRVMLDQLPGWVVIRRRNAAQLTAAFRRLPGLASPPAACRNFSFLLQILRVPAPRTPSSGVGS